MSHILLLGDSVFDNGAYVGTGAPDVAGQLRSRLPAGAEVSLLAVDGHYTTDVSSQIKRMPSSATHLFVSVGGNDALQYLRTIEESRAETTRFPEAISKLKGFQEDFRDSYDPMVGELMAAGVPAALCTIYNGHFEDPAVQSLVDTILPVINDVIVEAAIDSGLPLIDLGRALSEPEKDYANPIEPSAHGGEKIAEAVLEVCDSYDFDSQRTEIYT